MTSFSKNRGAVLVLMGLLAIVCGRLRAEDLSGIPSSSTLDRGFSGLYNLDFAGAQKDFASWEEQHPDDPMGPVSEAAGFLFSEFNRLGILEAQFYENDKTFFDRPKQTPDPALRQNFQNAIARSEALAHARLAKDPKDRDALFARTLAAGLQADYAALIEKRNLASLHFTKEASASAQQLLAVCADCYTRCWRQASASTSSEACRRPYVGCFASEACQRTSREELRTFRSPLSAGTISHRSRASCWRSRTYGRRTRRARSICSPI